MSRPYFIQLDNKTVSNLVSDLKLYHGNVIYPETVDRLCVDETDVSKHFHDVDFKKVSLNWIRDVYIPNHFERNDVYPIYESTQGYKFAGYVNGDYTHFYFYTVEAYKRHNVDKHYLIRTYRISLEYFKAIAQQNDIVYNITQGNQTLIVSKTYKHETKTV